MGPPFTIAKLVNIPPITMFHDAQITIEFMGVLNHNITRGAHIVIIYTLYTIVNQVVSQLGRWTIPSGYSTYGSHGPFSSFYDDVPINSTLIFQ